MEMFASSLACPVCDCGGRFSSMDQLCLKLQHLLNVGIPCCMCTKTFPTLSELYNHLLTHRRTEEQSLPNDNIKKEPPQGTQERDIDEIDQLLNDFSEYMKEDLEKTKISAQPYKQEEQMTPESAFRNSSIMSSTIPPQPYKTEMSSPQAQPQQTQSRQSVQCELCGWNFDDETYLQLHKILMHSGNRNNLNNESVEPAKGECFRCPTCSHVSIAFEDHVTHLVQVHGDRRSVCRYCGKLFKLRGSLLVHQRVVHGPGSAGVFHCSVCNRKFNNAYRRDVHERRHAASASVTNVAGGKLACGKCDGVFDTRQELEIHVQSCHHGDPVYTCEHCEESFETQTALVLHSVCHIKTKSVTLQFHQNGEKQEHKVATNFKCTTCGKTFAKEHQLNQHNKSHIPKQWECEVCHKNFTTKYFLKKHNRLHTGETPYECKICGRAFTFQQSFHKHMLYHTDEKPYSCSQCGRAFKELSTLQNHERIHSGERPFECETCGKSFRQRVSYLVHRRIHTGVMPYSCRNCGKSFRYKVTQRTHKCTQLGDQDAHQHELQHGQHQLPQQSAQVPQFTVPPTSFQEKQRKNVQVEDRMGGLLITAQQPTKNETEEETSFSVLKQLLSENC